MADHPDTRHDPLADFGLTEAEASTLLDLAERAIQHRLAGHGVPDVDLVSLPPSLHRPAGAFVTLRIAGELNGCIGNVDGDAAVAVSVAELAVKAAFDDPRLPALRPTDLAELTIEISLMSVGVTVPAGSRSELLGHVEPFRHGLILASGNRRALFLPDVWEQLRRPDEFLDHLLHKAGIPTGSWPADLRAERFTTASVRRPASRRGWGSGPHAERAP